MSSLSETFNSTDKAAPGHYGPSQTALLLLDFHSMFVEKAGGSEAPAAMQVAANMRKWAKSQGISVIHCLIDVNQKPFETCKNSARFAEIASTMKSSGADREPPELLGDSDGDNDVTFLRTPGYVSALRSPGLQEFLQERGIKSLVLTGLSTSGCVLRTAMAACDAEYVVTVISDGCADGGEGVHDFVIGKLLGNRGYVATASEFQNGFIDVSAGH